jgi:aspartate kinase
MINLVVNKIGGSILKSPNQLNKAVTTISENQSEFIIVVSALYGVTDQLIKATQKTNFKEDVQQIQNNHLKWLTESKSPKTLRATINKLLQIIIDLEIDLAFYKENKNPHIYARIISTGERLASVIVQYYFGGEAEIILPEKIELQTTNHATRGVYLTNTQLSKKIPIEKYQKYIIPGFYGINEFDQHCLTGRGGSDYTAAFLANLLLADELIYWKDSNGIQTANPEIVTNAENVTDINLHVLTQMSHAGSKILHPKVTSTLKDYNGKISFRNPLFGNQILTKIHTNKSSSGRAIIIDKQSDNNPGKSIISIITRNKTAAVVAIQQLKNIFSGVQILDISDQLVTFQTRTKNRTEAIRILHNNFHQQKTFSIQSKSLVNTQITV